MIQPNRKVLNAVNQPEPTLQFDQSYIGASTSKLDRSKVFEACAIVEGVTPSGGTKKKPKLSIKDVREALDRRGAEFLFDELLPYPVGENLLAKKFTCGLNSSTTAQTIRSGNPTR